MSHSDHITLQFHLRNKNIKPLYRFIILLKTALMSNLKHSRMIVQQILCLLQDKAPLYYTFFINIVFHKCFYFTFCKYYGVGVVCPQ